ncbi:hypothetical protein SPBR_02389 [Sporothrix brasiliensis 5110]|uniref:laccase n=1 Tax=Sporothrix brasiliensis 5110 TaxID=1398154 RepID=A0A0C2ITD6_9PEZI|nr:uncharacterized protein SPBR_02389 [Sporothrix brasiliensis 5110]KIH92351.1 hypothetical protein SPBR_02389 [Sporothrix brasiliensis 5110]
MRIPSAWSAFAPGALFLGLAAAAPTAPLQNGTVASASASASSSASTSSVSLSAVPAASSAPAGPDVAVVTLPAEDASAFPGLGPDGSQRQNCNTPSNRACWQPGFDINTDWEVNTPTTGVVRSYTFVITEVDGYVGADGVSKQKAMLINGQFPGPTINANWGDTISVNVINKLQTNGTGIHWHGLRQLNNNINDGVPGVTECPVPPGHNKTYTFTATQYGTSWYHTHVSSQYAYGVTGSIRINGPASLDYDIDLGPFPISDWYYPSADQLLARVSSTANPFVPGQPGASPPSDNLFFNGTNINPRDPSQGAYATVTLAPGKRHRLRLINPSVDNTFTVSIVGHQMTVIATDFVPVDAYTTSSLFLGVGQRYDVTIDASQAVGNYWINATFSGTHVCGSSANRLPAAILHYEGAPVYSPHNTTAGNKDKGGSHPGAVGLPTDPGTPPPDSFCADNTDFVPIVPRTAPLAQFEPVARDTLPVALSVKGSRVFWSVNGSAIDVAWDRPTLQTLNDRGSSFGAFNTSENIIVLDEKAAWSFWLIQNESPVPHPMHLHGHDFLILGQSPAPANPLSPTAGPVEFNMIDKNQLGAANPVRRDATMLPSFGWLLVAFESTNPGAWLFHCHIAWHASQGLSAQFVEKRSQIRQAMDLNALNQNCRNWDAYEPTDPFQQTDSGL